MTSPYEDQFRKSIDDIIPGISYRLEELPSRSDDEAERVLVKMLQASCRATNSGLISIGRRALSELPSAWLESRLLVAIDAALDLKDDWDYRRLLELLKMLNLKGLLATFIMKGSHSENSEIQDAARDFSKT